MDIKQQISKSLNTLVIDDSNPVNYKHSEISNDNKLTFEQFYEMFKSDTDVVFSDISKRLISLVLYDFSEIPLSEYKKDMFPCFLVIHTDDIDHDLIISTAEHHYMQTGLQWFRESIAEIYNYAGPQKMAKHNNLDGYKNTWEIYQSVLWNSKPTCNYEYMIPAVNYCRVLHIKDIIDSDISYDGYLPSKEELYALIHYIDLVNYIFKKIGVSEINLLKSSGQWWTSSESDDGAYIIDRFYCPKDAPPQKADKDKFCGVLPFFRKIIKHSK